MADKPFARVIAAVATPFRADLAVDHARLVAHMEWLLANGCDGLLLFGTTGEASSLTVGERNAALDAVLEAGIPAKSILVGTGCCAVGDTVALTMHAAEVQCAGALIVPPFYYKGVSEAGVARFYEMVIAGCGASLPPIYLYHIPQVSGVGVSPALVGTLLARYGATIRGYKDSSGQWSNTAELLARFASLDVFVGSENFLLDNLRNGGAGCISAGVNVQPRAVGDVLERARTREAESALAKANAVRLALEKTGPLIPAVKAALAHIHGDANWLVSRPPLEPLAPPVRDALLSELRALSVAGIG